MITFSSKLRIGEKIGLGFALVGLLFVGVVCLYHQALQSVLGDYQQLQSVFAVQKSLALEIEFELAAARNAEKNFLIHHRERFVDEVDEHVQRLREAIGALAAVDQDLRQTAEEISRPIAIYHERFHAVVSAWRVMGLDENSGLQGAFREKVHRLHELSSQYKAGGAKGPFRDAAQRIETLPAAYHIPNLETSVLKLRRREKDFLLRGDASYPPMVVAIAGAIRSQVASSPIADADKTLLVGLLRDYERDFLALVAQRARIGLLTREMDAAADRVAPLLEQNVDHANRAMAARVNEIAESSQASVWQGLRVMACAIALAILFAAVITARIVCPVRQMAGLLDDLAYGTPTQRIPTVPGGRDEINAMAVSLNALADHRKNFIDWWKTSMNELLAQRDLDSADSETARDEARRVLNAAALAKVEQLDTIRSRLLPQAERVVDVCRRARAPGRSLREDDARSLENAALSMTTLLEVVAVERDRGRSSARSSPGT